MKLSVIVLLAFAFAACSEGPSEPTTELAPVSAGSIVDGRAGPFDMSEITIDQVGSFYADNGDLCLARYAEGVNGNSVISNGGNNPRTEATIHVVDNRNYTLVMCRITDTSLIYEDDAEVGTTVACRAALADGRILEGGTGRVTAAANNEEGEGEDILGNDGGNVMMQCRFAQEG